MKVVVTGAGGFLGKRVVAELVKRGHHVIAMVRSDRDDVRFDASVATISADLRYPDRYEAQIAGSEAVIHLAAATSGSEDQQFNGSVVGTEKFIAVLERLGIGRIIFISSIVVSDNGKTGREMTEDSEQVSDLYQMAPYTVAKTWQERIMREAAVKFGWNLTVLRPGYIWSTGKMKIAGIGPTAGPLHFLIAPMAKLPITHVENCAACIGHVLDRTPAGTEIFNVIDSEDVTSWKYARALFKINKTPKLIVPVPYVAGLALVKVIDFFSGWILGPTRRVPSFFIPKRFSAQFKPLHLTSTQLRTVTGWVPPRTFEECLTRDWQA